MPVLLRPQTDVPPPGALASTGRSRQVQGALGPVASGHVTDTGARSSPERGGLGGAQPVPPGRDGCP